MPVDLITIMAFEDGQLNDDDTARMLGEMLSSGEIKTLPNKYTNLAKQYVRRGMITSDGEILI